MTVNIRMRFLTLWLAVLSVLAGAGGALTTLLDSFGKAGYVSYILLAAGAAGALLSQGLHTLDIQTGPLSAGTVRVITAINGFVGSFYTILGGVVTSLPPSGNLGRVGPLVVSGVGFLQTMLTGVLHQVDANVNASAATPTPSIVPAPVAVTPTPTPASYPPIAVT